MVFVRKRYYAWLFKAYFKRWKKTIFTSVILGGLLFFAILSAFSIYIQPKLEKKVERIGMVGVFSLKDMPEEVINDISYGLTAVNSNGEIVPAAAVNWEIKDNGKTYIFYLNKNLRFHDGENFNAINLDLSFKDVKKKVIDNYTVSYTLKDSYSPFLTTVSKPIVKKNYAGLGLYKLVKADINAGYVRSISIQNNKDGLLRKDIFFYPTIESLKIAFALGDIDKAIGFSDISMKDKNFNTWNNVLVKRVINHKKLVALFYNNTDRTLSDKRLRQALNFALPEEFEQGETSFSPILPGTIYYNKIDNYSVRDVEISRTLLSSNSTEKFKLEIEISTIKDYLQTAEKIKKSWERIGVHSKIIIVDEIPEKFQILLYSFKVPKDPDQYTLWHSDQVNNLARYNNKRIDKLLEDGRTNNKVNERIKIYNDFQKYLLDDAPVSFLFYPYQYQILRTI